MILNDWLECLKYTITTYNKNMKLNLLELYIDEGIARKRNKQVSIFDDNKIEIDEDDLDGTIYSCFKNNIKAIYLFEKFNSEKMYKYSAIFKSNSRIKDVLHKFNSIPYLDDNYILNKLEKTLGNPVKVEKDNKVVLMFNKKFEAFHPQTKECMLLKFPIIVIFDMSYDLIEIRFDSIKKIFSLIDRENEIYDILIKEVLKYIENYFGIICSTLHFEKIVKLADSKEFPRVKKKLLNQDFKEGSGATLRATNDGKYTLPFIGELKILIVNLKDELDKCPVVKNELERFIRIKEETAESRIVEIDFIPDDDVMSKINRVKFTFNHQNKGYCLLNYYSNKYLLGMERMDNVTNFIKENII